MKQEPENGQQVIIDEEMSLPFPSASSKPTHGRNKTRTNNFDYWHNLFEEKAGQKFSVTDVNNVFEQLKKTSKKRKNDALHVPIYLLPKDLEGQVWTAFDDINKRKSTKAKADIFAYWQREFGEKLGRSFQQSEVRQVFDRIDEIHKLDAMTTPTNLMSTDLTSHVWSAFDEWVTLPRYKSIHFDKLTESKKQSLLEICNEVLVRWNKVRMWEERAQLATERLGLVFTAQTFKTAVKAARYGPEGMERSKRVNGASSMASEPPHKKRKTQLLPLETGKTYNHHLHYGKLTEDQKQYVVATKLDVPNWPEFSREPIAQHKLWEQRAQLATERLGYKFNVGELKKALTKACTKSRVATVKAARNSL